MLSNYFLVRLSDKFGGRKNILTTEAIEHLKENYWNGNVRELQNTLERAVILSKDGIIKSKHLHSEKYDSSTETNNNSINQVDSFVEETAKVILRALKQTKGKIYGAEGAAELLKMKPTTLQSKIKKFRLGPLRKVYNSRFRQFDALKQKVLNLLILALFVSAGGLEPPTFTLKGCCSTTELRAQNQFFKGSNII